MPHGPAAVENQIIAAIRRVMRAIDLQSHKLVARYGLTGPQIVTLRALERLGQGSPSLLAREVSVSPATLSGILSRLEKRGLVHRSRNLVDRRAFTFRLTARGSRTLQGIPSLLEDRFRKNFIDLEEWERTAILSTLQRVAAMMEAKDFNGEALLTTESVDANSVEDGLVADLKKKSIVTSKERR